MINKEAMKKIIVVDIWIHFYSDRNGALKK